ncbi:MAG: protocatechuate 3,4-dioxygenase subunit alpha [Shimia sp.]
MSPLKETPSQTAGPYLHIGLQPDGPLRELPNPYLLGGTMPDAAPLLITGQMLDGAGAPVTDAMIEAWHPQGTADRGWARIFCDAEGKWTLSTTRPHDDTPFITVWIVARGIMVGLTTRVYLPSVRIAADPLLSALGPRARTLIAVDDGEGRLRHDIRLQGADETVFLDI